MNNLVPRGTTESSARIIGRMAQGSVSTASMITEFAERKYVRRKARKLFADNIEWAVGKPQPAQTIYALGPRELGLSIDELHSMVQIRKSIRVCGYGPLTAPAMISCFLNMEMALRKMLHRMDINSFTFFTESLSFDCDRPMAFRFVKDGAKSFMGVVESYPNNKRNSGRDQFLVSSEL